MHLLNLFTVLYFIIPNDSKFHKLIEFLSSLDFCFSQEKQLISYIPLKMQNFEMYLSLTWNLFYHKIEDTYRWKINTKSKSCIFHFESEGRELSSLNI